MHYILDATCKDWKENKKYELAKRLTVLVQKFCFRYEKCSPHQIPFIEVDKLNCGVTVRKITHLIEKNREEFIKEVDLIYTEVMKTTS